MTAGSASENPSGVSMAELVSDLAKTKHISLEEAAKIVDGFMARHPNEGPDLMDRIGKFGEIMMKLPEDMRQAMIKAVGPAAIMGGEQRETRGNDDMFNELVMKVTAMKTLTSDDSEAKEEIRALREQLAKLLEEKQTSQVAAQIQALEDHISELEQKIVTAPAPVVPVDPAEALVEQFKKTEDMKKTLESIFGGTKQPDETEVIESLKKKGFRVEPPADLEKVQAEWQARIDELKQQMNQEKENIKQQTIEEMKRKQEQERMYLDFAQNIIGTILDNLTSGEKANMGNLVKGALSALRMTRARAAQSEAAAGAGAGAGAGANG